MTVQTLDSQLIGRHVRFRCVLKYLPALFKYAGEMDLSQFEALEKFRHSRFYVTHRLKNI